MNSTNFIIMNKYNKYRSEIKNGDIVLFRGASIQSRLIQKFDNAYYNHIGLVFESNKRLLILDSNAPGVNPDFLSSRMEENNDFCIISPISWDENQIAEAVGAALDKAASHIKYDFDLLAEIAIYRETKIKLNLDNTNKDICSEFVRRYTSLLTPAPICFDPKNLPTPFITPWDFIIYADSTQFKIKFDDINHQDYRAK